MPYSNGATLRFLVPAVLRGSQRSVCRLTRVSISSDSVYHDDSDDSGASSVIPIAYRPVSSPGSTDGESMDGDKQSLGSPALTPPPGVPSLLSPSPSPISFRSWSVAISTASSDEFEYDNYDDDDDDTSDASLPGAAANRSNVQRRRKPAAPLPLSPFDFGSIAAPSRTKGSKVSSQAPRKAAKRGKSTGRAPTDQRSPPTASSPVGSSGSGALGSTVIRLVPPSVDIFQTLLDLGPAPRSRSSSTGGNANGGGSISGGSGGSAGGSSVAIGDGLARSERSLSMPTPTEEEVRGAPGASVASSGAEGAGVGGGEDSEGRPMASLAVPELTDDDQTSDELEDELEEELESAEAGLLNLARLGCRVQFASTVIDNERGAGADGSGPGPSGLGRM
ncbi:uncharacterized protein LOC133392078 [Anopheles gambiae]|uniref:uncharacterized protein LOC133392078 n=1 Tax=Anopheles gambiae TaxID=7165 RepID=UPI002AC96FD7|nr:uncharacterized protein LOC133392078 [Anopheles gambiae]